MDTDDDVKRTCCSIFHTAVWTGTQMIVWGGIDSNAFELNTGGRYCAQPATPIMQGAVSRKTHGSAGSLDVNLPLSGTPGIECRSGGATSDYTIVLTLLANVSVTGSPQAAVTSGIGAIGSGGVSNGGMVIVSDNVVIIPLTNVANAQTINVTLNNVNGSTNLTIPMRLLIGDTNGDGLATPATPANTQPLRPNDRCHQLPLRCGCRWLHQQRRYDRRACAIGDIFALERNPKVGPPQTRKINQFVKKVSEGDSTLVESGVLTPICPF